MTTYWTMLGVVALSVVALLAAAFAVLAGWDALEGDDNEMGVVFVVFVIVFCFAMAGVLTLCR